MRPFRYAQPRQIDEVLSRLGEADGGVRLLAGGQSLNMALKDRSVGPASVVSVCGVPELRGLSYAQDGRLHVGATTTYAELARAGLQGWHAELCTVAGNLADRSVRSIATIGGAACQAEPRYDVPALLVGVDAELRLVSQAGERTLHADAFFAASGGTCLSPAELLTGIVFPAAAAHSGVALEKFCYRSFEAAILIVVCAISLDERGVATAARLAVGAIEKAPLLATGAAALIIGRRHADLPLADLAEQVSRDVLPLERQVDRQRRYQAELVKSLARKAVTRAFDEAASGVCHHA